MSIRSVQQYQFRAPFPQKQPPYFELKAIELDVACVVNEDRKSAHYSIYFIEEGEGEYEIDFQSFRIQQAGLFFLTPGQVFQVASEKVKKGFQISFDQDFYCIETHGKEIACDGVLFNAVNGHGALVDRGANGGLAGKEVRVIATTDRCVDISGIDMHEWGI